MLPTIEAPQAPPTYLTLQQAVTDGYGAYSTLRSWIAKDLLPAVRIGGRVKVRLADLQALVSPRTPGTWQHQPPTGQCEQPERCDADIATVERIVSAMPPLTGAQRERLASILGGAR